MLEKQSVVIHWFRRDLRLHDNTALYHALQSTFPVLPVFIFDTNILNDLEDKNDARVTYIYDALQKMQNTLKTSEASLQILLGDPLSVWKELTAQYDIKAVYWNKDYEPYAIARDKQVSELLQINNIPYHTYKDHVIFEENEVLKDDNKPYTVFTPYSKKYGSKLTDNELRYFPSEKYTSRFLTGNAYHFPEIQTLGFVRSDLSIPSSDVDEKLITQYHLTRNYPAKSGTSRLSVHLRFGTISIRSLARVAMPLNTTFVNELIWRDFYQMILFHFPHVVRRSFKPAYDNINWNNDEKDFEAWCNGLTGYPMVDAGMRELNATGFMHNRVRMIVASFLTKHLLIDWRWGEAYFARKLLDFELASNNGGWQWAAGSGCDAAPYFRIFNPEEQMKKFDANAVYIKKWIPEFNTKTYPLPIVDHAFARNRALEVYKNGLK